MQHPLDKLADNAPPNGMWSNPRHNPYWSNTTARRVNNGRARLARIMHRRRAIDLALGIALFTAATGQRPLITTPRRRASQIVVNVNDLL